MKEWTVEATTDAIPGITAEIGRELEALECSKQAQRQINVALDELLSNIANYAYAPGTGEMTVRMQYDAISGMVSLTFIDGGVPYNPLEKPDPDVTQAIEERQIGGLGILMVKKKMDGMTYRREGNLNMLTIHKQIHGG